MLMLVQKGSLDFSSSDRVWIGYSGRRTWSMYACNDSDVA